MMMDNKSSVKSAILDLILTIVALALILMGSLFVFLAISGVNDVSVLGIGIEMQLIGGLIFLIRKRFLSKDTT
jgi:hypothetical protein